MNTRTKVELDLVLNYALAKKASKQKMSYRDAEVTSLKKQALKSADGAPQRGF